MAAYSLKCNSSSLLTEKPEVRLRSQHVCFYVNVRCLMNVVHSYLYRKSLEKNLLTRTLDFRISHDTRVGDRLFVKEETVNRTHLEATEGKVKDGGLALTLWMNLVMWHWGE